MALRHPHRLPLSGNRSRGSNTGPDDRNTFALPTSQEKGPAFRRDLHTASTTNLNRSELAVLALLTLLPGVLALTARILLLLSRLLTAALLLAGLLPRILILLAGILVWIGHCNLPC